MRILPLLTLGCALACAPAAAAAADDASAPINPGTPWPATDALGRAVPTSPEVGPPRRDRFVGIFYFLWLNERRNRAPQYEGPYDVSKILARDPDVLRKPDSPLWGRMGQAHYWGESLYGYYLSDDPWVLRRHAHLLADAGIDTLIFDTTNAVTYKRVYLKLCEVFAQVRAQGGRAPQIAFMVNTKAGETAREIYEDLYKPNLHSDLWFRWGGKPLMICDPAATDAELREFFTLRRAHWPFEMIDTPYAWHWEAAYPQPYGFTDDPAKPEQVNVSVAQNLRAEDAKVCNMSSGQARGRSFHDGKMDRTPGAVNHGHNFAEQWRRARELDPPFVMVTGWNEWIAGRFERPGEPVAFVDQFDQEFSRDIEPMRGGHGDNYYYQLVANVRRHKGAPPLPTASAPKTIDVAGGFDQWQDVGPDFNDHLNETLPRDFPGAGGLHYRNHTGRNDLAVMKVARDERSVYFYARTQKPLTPSTEPAWMWLMIDADGDAKTGWQGYDFIVNRATVDGAAWLERHAGDGWNWSKVAKVVSRADGNQLHLAISREAIGTADDSRGFNFKWADHLQHPGDVMDFYLSGDVAPEGRFAYRYVACEEER